MKRIHWISVSLATIGSALSACGDDGNVTQAGNAAASVQVVERKAERGAQATDHVKELIESRSKAESKISHIAILCQQ